MGKLLAEFVTKTAGWLHNQGREVVFWGRVSIETRGHPDQDATRLGCPNEHGPAAGGPPILQPGVSPAVAIEALMKFGEGEAK